MPRSRKSAPRFFGLEQVPIKITTTLTYIKRVGTVSLEVIMSKIVEICITSQSFPQGETLPIEITFSNPYKNKKLSEDQAEAETKRIEDAIKATVRRLGYKPEEIPVL